MGTMFSDADQKSRRRYAAFSKGQAIAPGRRLLNGIFLSLILLLPFLNFGNSTNSQSTSSISPSPASGLTRKEAAAAPSIRSVSPNPLTGSNSSQTVTINGTNSVNKPTVLVTWTRGPTTLAAAGAFAAPSYNAGISAVSFGNPTVQAGVGADAQPRATLYNIGDIGIFKIKLDVVNQANGSVVYTNMFLPRRN